MTNKIGNSSAEHYCEQCLKAAIRTGTTQYVILGTGTAAFGLYKGGLKDRLKIFEVDFTCGELKENLLAKGFDVTKKTFFSWLQSSWYSSFEQFSVLLKSISSFAAEGSTLLFNYVDAELFSTGKMDTDDMLSSEHCKRPVEFCTGEMQLMMLLEKYHFLIYEHLSPAQTVINTSGCICYVTAVLKGTAFINTKEKILQTALTLFARNGFEAVSVKDIADRLGLTKAALYKHYQGKGGIFDAIIDRMEHQDAERAKLYEVPVQPADSNPDVYRKTRIQNLADYTVAQFRYWTADPFASRFRRMLTLEQYRNSSMTALYQQYLCSGPLFYTRDIFSRIMRNPSDAEMLAAEFFAPVYFLYSLYDGIADKEIPEKMLKTHISGFIRRFFQSEEGKNATGSED